MGAPEGPFVLRESELKTLSGDQFLSSTPRLPCLFAGRSPGGHDFDGLWVRAVPSALLTGPFVCRASELKTLSGDRSDSRRLVFLPVTRLAGMALAGFRFEPPPCVRSLWALRFSCKGAEDVKWRPIPLLNSHYLVFLSAARMVGMTLTGFGLESFLRRS